VSGTLIYSDKEYGTVTIDTGSVKVLFLHMANRIEVSNVAANNKITVGKKIGTVSGIDVNGTSTFSAHLHVEVHSRSASNKSFAYQVNSFRYPDGLLPVYNYF